MDQSMFGGDSTVVSDDLKTNVNLQVASRCSRGDSHSEVPRKHLQHPF